MVVTYDVFNQYTTTVVEDKTFDDKKIRSHAE